MTSLDSDRQSVCLVTASHIGSTPRVVKEANALHLAGLRVKVISIRTLDEVEPRDQSVLRDAAWSCERIDLRSRFIRWPYRFFQEAARHAFSMTRASGLAIAALSAFTPSLSRAALRTPADLYVAHYPAALAAASLAAQRHGAQFAFDAEDFHPGDWSNAQSHDLDRKILSTVERSLLPNCAHVTAASPGIARAYAQAYDIVEPRVILNTFPLSQAHFGPTRRGNAVPGPSVYWFSQVIGPGRGLECAVKAIALSSVRPHLYIRGTPASEFAELLMRLATSLGVSDRLHFLPPEAPSQMEKLAAAYDLGLVAETGQTTNRQIALTNKLFSYVLAGVPAAMSDISAHRTFAEGTGMTDLLFTVDDAVSLTAVFDRFLGSPARLAACREATYRLGRDRYNWEVESAGLVDIVMQSLKVAHT